MIEKKYKIQKSREWWSVWALLSRSSFYKVLAVLLLMVLGECISFWRILRGDSRPDSLEELVSGSGAFVFFMAALGVILLILVWTVGQAEEKSQNTLMRLKLSGQEIFYIRTVYCTLCLTLLFSVQIIVILFTAEIYEKVVGTPGLPQQFLFLAFYRNEFLHGLLPMAETGKWARNLLLILAFAVETAGSRKTGAVTLISLFVLAAAWFISPVGMGYRDGIVDFVCIVVIGADILQMLLSREQE
nr:hypothetical protein [uncultured Acetatifactor sp.]